MKRLNSLFILLLTMLSLMSCNNVKTSDEILQECGSGVVMIVNQYYYKLTLPTGQTWYFKGFDSDGDLDGLTLDLSEIQNNRNIITGTYNPQNEMLQTGKTKRGKI